MILDQTPPSSVSQLPYLKNEALEGLRTLVVQVVPDAQTSLAPRPEVRVSCMCPEAHQGQGWGSLSAETQPPVSACSRSPGRAVAMMEVGGWT